jgi:hypothetical protein
MSASIILSGVAVFLAAAVIHVLLWRYSPARSTLVLLAVFLLAPAAALLACGAFLAANRTELIAIYLLHFALAMAYIASYPAVKALSPSLDIILLIAGAPGGRLAEASLVERFTGPTLIADRMADLREYRLIRETGGRIELTLLARTIVRFFAAYRWLLGLPAGKG